MAKLLVRGHFGYQTAYGYIAEQVAIGLHSLGADIAVAPCLVDRHPPHLNHLLNKPNSDHGGELIITTPEGLGGYRPRPPYYVYTMWEAEALNREWVDLLSAARAVLVPSEWCRVVFAANGVTAPIHKVPLGYDDSAYYQVLSLPKRCTFGVAAQLMGGGFRKNVEMAVTAFKTAFAGIDNVSLRIKLTPHCAAVPISGRNIEVARAHFSGYELLAWYNSLTAFINVSSAEGFGLHALEAMACGRVLVSTHYSGVTEFFDDDVGVVVAHELSPATKVPYRGQWSMPVMQSLVEALRWIYDNNLTLGPLAEQAANRARSYRWRNSGRVLHKTLQTLGAL